MLLQYKNTDIHTQTQYNLIISGRPVFTTLNTLCIFDIGMCNEIPCSPVTDKSALYKSTFCPLQIVLICCLIINVYYCLTAVGRFLIRKREQNTTRIRHSYVRTSPLHFLAFPIIQIKIPFSEQHCIFFIFHT